MTRTIWWEDGQVKMIDQRILPLHYEILGYADYRDVAEAIIDMVVRGAPAIGAAGAYGMALAAFQSPATDRDSFLRDLAAAQAVLDASRPTAVNLNWATTRIMDLAHHLVLPTIDELRSTILAEAERIADEDVAINRRIGAFGAEIVPQAVAPQTANILTHCNTGSLATVDYGTALGIVRAAVEAGKQVHVWVDETRPRLQGARLTAWELMRDGIPMTLIADNAAGMLMWLGKVDLVLFGADRVAANGDVANKIGSYKLAVIARENGVPCYSVVPTPTIDLSLAHGDLIPIEERSACEVTHVGAEQIAPDGVPVYNPAFDVTPHRYLTGIITDEGICYPPFEMSLRRAVEMAEKRRGLGTRD
jgi:methylthioribose-1-phosphate isomerase